MKRFKRFTVLLLSAVFVFSMLPAGILAEGSEAIPSNLTNRFIIEESTSGVITKEGDLYMWGKNDCGQVGNGNKEDVLSPVKVLENVKYLDITYNRSGAITNDGSLYLWGYNWGGEIGNGEQTTNQLTPVKVMDNVTALSLGGDHSGALTTDGTLYLWGSNASGQLGVPGGHTTPVKVMEDVVSFDLGDHTSMALKSDGTLWVWGGNPNGELGLGEENIAVSVATPQKLADNVRSFAPNEGYAFVKNDDTLWSWGDNFFGMAGTGDAGKAFRPVKILDDVRTVAYGGGSIKGAIKNDGSLYTWGGNENGELGDGTTEARKSPVKVLNNVKTFAPGSDHSLAITTDGSLYSWGRNGYGQLGREGDPMTPGKVTDNVAAIDTAIWNSAMVKTDGSLYIWGYGWQGQIGNGVKGDVHTPYQVFPAGTVFEERPAVPVIGITTPESLELAMGERVELDYTIEPAEATNQNVTITSSDENVVKIMDKILITVGPGEATVTVKTEDGNFTDTCKVTVKENIKPGGFSMGNIDGDKNDSINASDALMALRHSVEEITLEGDAFTRGDVTYDGKINASDALQILRFSVKEIDKFVKPTTA